MKAVDGSSVNHRTFDLTQLVQSSEKATSVIWCEQKNVFIRKLNLYASNILVLCLISADKMGNCHTVGPNEALVVSGNVTDRQRCVSAPRVRSVLVELEEGFTGKQP